MTKNKPYFGLVETKVDFPKEEKKIIKRWYKEGVLEKYLQKNKTSGKYYSFLDGPITANNPMGVHHAWGRTYKDLWQRFYNMRGFKQRFQNGFDCQGLWVEVEVEKELGLKTKKDIENLVPGNKKESIAKFVELCKERVFYYAKIQTEQSKRLGYFMDWENSYYTLSDDNNYMIWYFLKKCHERGLIYKGEDVVPWCPRCETAISEHEILTEDYKEVTHESLYLRFPVKEKENEYLLVWTTTPWTVPANTSIAVDGDLDYVLVKEDDARYWVAAKLAAGIFGKGSKVVNKVKGKRLVGLKYEAAFDEIPAVAKNINKKGFHEVIATDKTIMPISEDEGTGLVHTSTSTGAEDHKLGKKFDLPVIPAIENDASYLPSFGFLAGKNAKSHPEIVIDYLRNYQSGRFLYKTEKYKHRYPACWRCKKELVWKLTDEWYIAIDPLREAMKNVTKNIKWIPSFGLKRELDWLNNMHDWLISKKNRYWGLALPIWECKKCGNFEVIGSYEELKERAVEGWGKFVGHTPHKPWIDEVKVECTKCGEVMQRIPDVGNPWLDAGIVPYSTISKDNKSKPLYWENKKEWEKWFPADFITESFPGQFKNWFYSLIAMSTVLESREPFKTVLGFATLLAEDGRPMHKSWGNAIEFNEGAEKIGVDVMRWMYAKQNPSENLLFGYKIADETRRKFHLTLWNIYNFFVTYANLDGWKPSPAQGTIKNLLDAWAVNRLRETIIGVTESLEKYDAQTATILIEGFVKDLSTWYIRRSRSRVGLAASDEADKNDFYVFCYLILINLSKILAPFTPFMADIIFTNLVKHGPVSVHLAEWPDDKFLKEVQIMLGKKGEVDKLMKDMELTRLIVEKGQSVRKEKKIPVRQPLKSITVYYDQKLDARLLKLIEDELNVKCVFWKDGEELKVKLDTKITPELMEEAKTRELIRKIQERRKELGVGLSDKVIVKTPWLPKSDVLLTRLKKVTLAESVERGNFEVKLYSK